MADVSVPAAYLCPITQSIMSDPVIDREGNSFERTAIEAWLAVRGNSPVTRTPLTTGDLAPNRSLRTAIEAFLDGLTPEVAATLRATMPPTPTPTTTSPTLPPLPPAPVSPPAPLPALTIEVCSTRSLTEQDLVMATVVSPGDAERVPSDIVCVIDVSGSMSGDASTAGAEQTSLNLLDITKHAVKTIINTLGEKDRLAIVKFSDAASVVCELAVMDAAGRARATSLCEGLDTEGSTNLWDGLLKGMDQLKSRGTAMCAGIPGDARNAAVYLLTDGQPSVEPPRGHIPMLQRYRDNNGGKFPGIITTFGFGYNLDSKLLAQLAEEGGGMYSFIPDAGFVGTAFVHALSNTLTTVARNVTIKLQPADGASDARLLGYPEGRFQVSWGFDLKMSSVQAGQDVNVAVLLNRGSAPASSVLEASLSYLPSSAAAVSDSLTGSGGDISASSASASALALQLAEIASQRFRLEFVRLVGSALELGLPLVNNSSANFLADPAFSQAKAALGLDSGTGSGLLAEVRAWLAANAALPDCPPKQRIKGLLDDLEGQVKEALSREDFFSRWGRHYLPSLCRAHQLQQANNFKDPGLQFYGGQLFRSIRDQADDIFSELPPPAPAARPTYGGGYGGGYGARSAGPAYAQAQAQAAPATFSMRSFNSRNTPCVHALSQVLLATATDGQGKKTKAAQDVVRGDVVAILPAFCSSQHPVVGTDASRALGRGRVVCVVKTLCKDGWADLVSVPGGLRVTPWHPVCVNGAWTFPAAIGSCERVQCGAVFSFLVEPLEDEESAQGGLNYAAAVVIDGTSVAALAHGVSPSQDAVLGHAFFGTERIVADLKRTKGWSSPSGVVTFTEGCLLRKEGEEGLVYGLDLSVEVV